MEIRNWNQPGRHPPSTLHPPISTIQSPTSSIQPPISTIQPPTSSLHIPLTRARLRDLEECPRRFWLRSLAQRPWPAAPLPATLEAAAELGRRFHLVMHRHFLGLKVDAGLLPAELQEWWATWERHPIPLPPGRCLPEITLSAPLEGARLLVRFDLLALAGDGRALILDWKTEKRPRSRAQLAADIQTQLYPFVLAEASTALAGYSIVPEQIEMIYWQANRPTGQQTNQHRFPYSAGQHAANRARFGGLAARAQALRPDADAEPPLINDLSICARCTYRTYCGRERSSR